MQIDGTVAREALVQLLFENRTEESTIDNENERQVPQAKRHKVAPRIDLLDITLPIQIGSAWSDLLTDCGSLTVSENQLSTLWSVEPVTIADEQFVKAQLTIVPINDLDQQPTTAIADNEVLVYATQPATANGNSDSTLNHNANTVFLELARACVSQVVHTSVRIHVNGTRVEARMIVYAELDSRVLGNKTFFNLFDLLYPSKIAAPPSTTVEDFFRHLQPETSNTFLPAYQPEALIAKLAPFQSQNLQWMVEREGHKAVNGQIQVLEENNVYDTLPFLWEKVTLHSGRFVFVNRFSRQLLAEPRPEFEFARSLTRSGGVLADEMGLGKTICAIALILLHKLNRDDPKHPKDDSVSGLITSGATLIITPSSIINQWQAEIRQHAPSLRVKTYSGIKASGDKETITANELAQYDVVLTDYNVLKEEIHHARAFPERARRHAAKYPPRRSPLVEILWFRVMLDEAQMVESPTAMVGQMARIIPRWYSWGVTGTPMKTNYSDLIGLLLFLGFTPSIQKPKDFKELFPPNAPNWMKGLFWQFTKTIFRRNIKAALVGQIHIPPQYRNIVKLSFSAVEQHYYQSLREQCARSTNLQRLDAINWTPTTSDDSEDVDDFETSEAAFQQTYAKLRSWLLALRQACDHPAVGASKKRMITQTVRTLDEVLNALLAQARDDVDNASSALVNCQLRRGGMTEIQKQWQEALDIYLGAVPRALQMLERVDNRISEAKAKQKEEEDAEQAASNGRQEEDAVAIHRSTATAKTSTAIEGLVQRHIKWLSILHRFYFYIAGIYHELEKGQEESTYYEKAADMRRQILVRAEERVTMSKREIPRVAVPFNAIIGQCPQEETLILSFDRLERINKLCGILDSQLECINKWRATLSGLLCSNLIDQREGNEEENKDVTGDEYETSLITQEKLDLYQDAYQAMLRDRNFWVNGVWPTNLQSSELFQDLTSTTGADEIVVLKAELNEIRRKYMPESFIEDNLRKIVSELKEYIWRPRMNEVEKVVVRDEYNRLYKAAAKQRELQERLEIEYRRFTQLYNHRIEYYRNLQDLSDHVCAWEDPQPAIEAQRLSFEEGHHEKMIKEQSARCRYLENLVEEKNQEDKKERKCLICQSDFSKGLMTYCGHMYCRDCATIWFRSHHRCPQCNSLVRLSECYAIAWDTSSESKSSSKSTEDEQGRTQEKENPDVDREISNELLAKINKCAIEEGLGAKLDSIIRHIKHIILTTNGKSVVFSQWKDVLNLLADGLKKNDIHFVQVDNTVRDDRIKKFIEDPSIHVILLHSRSQSSGLTLICAQTVFIVEPVLNEALERQAISRVHRIGQTKETNIYWYIIQETIEERIHAIYSARHKRKIRMEQEGRRDDEIDETVVPLATQSEGGGERVTDQDLQRCFTSNESWALNL